MTLLLGFLFALAESSLGLGILLPGEIAITGLAAGVNGLMATASLGLVVAAGAVLGDHIGFYLGRRGGERLGSSRLVARLGVDRWERAADLIRRHGVLAVLASRLLPFIRTVMPAVAGASGMVYPNFLLVSVLGAVMWASIWVTAGAAIAASGVLSYLGYLVPVVVAVVVTVAAFRYRRRTPVVVETHDPLVPETAQLTERQAA